jgi:hypothetical protein
VCRLVAGLVVPQNADNIAFSSLHDNKLLQVVAQKVAKKRGGCAGDISVVGESEIIPLVLRAYTKFPAHLRFRKYAKSSFVMM